MRWDVRGKDSDLTNRPEVTDFIAHLRLKNLSPQSIVEYEKVLKGLFDHVALGDRSPKEITAAQLRDYVAGMQQRGLAAKTVSDRVLVLKRFFGFLLAEGYIKEDPSLRLPRPKVGKRLPRALTIPQVQALFAAMGEGSRTGRRDRVLFQLIYAGGLRVSEAVGLKVDDINFAQGTLRVIGKGDKERRIYLKPHVVEGLRQYIAREDLDGYLFPGRGGGHVTARNVEMRLKRYAQKAGLREHVSPHTLRHSIAVHYLLGGAPITFVQNLLGHESLATTGIYTQLTDEMTRGIALNTETALDGLEEGVLKEAAAWYEPNFEAWDGFVSEVLEWL